ncbi:hypothetical protein J6590_084700 [Homalodisca vitripennis]|nr:hypothetical protein J6590_084700 [Homalodisca vitripennis]
MYKCMTFDIVFRLKTQQRLVLQLKVELQRNGQPIHFCSNNKRLEKGESIVTNNRAGRCNRWISRVGSDDSLMRLCAGGIPWPELVFPAEGSIAVTERRDVQSVSDRARRQPRSH